MAITTTKVPLGGAVGKANYLDKVVDDLTMLDAAANGAWTDYSSSFQITASITSPTKGNSTYETFYKRIGKTTFMSVRITIGSTFVAGSGTYQFSLPVAAAISGVGSAFVFDSGTTALTGVVTAPAGATGAQITLTNSAGGQLGSAGPGTAWAAGDRIEFSMTYAGV